MSDAKTLAGLEISSPKEAKPTLSILLYGNSGVGKTVLAGSASAVPDLSPVLLIDVEAGVLSLRDRYPDIDVVRVQSWAEMQRLYKELRRDTRGYKTIIVDSLGELQKFSLNEIMRQLVKEEPDRDPDIPSMREWGKNLEQMRRIVRLFRDLPVNTIWTAHAQEETYGKSERTRTKVSLTGKLANEVSGFMDLVLYMYIKSKDKQQHRMLLSAQREDVIAKDRTNLLPTVVEDPTMEVVWSIIMGQIDPAVATTQDEEPDDSPEAVLEKAAKAK